MSLDRLAPAIFVLLWSTGWVVAKFGAIYSDPLTFLSVRYAVAAVLFAMLCRLAGVRWPQDRATSTWRRSGGRWGRACRRRCPASSRRCSR